MSKRRPGALYLSDFVPKHQLLCDQYIISLKYSLACEHTHFSKCPFSSHLSWGSEGLSLILLTPYAASCIRAFPRRVRLGIVRLHVCLSQTFALYASIPEDWAIRHMYAPCSHLHWCGGVSRDAVAYRGSLLSLVLPLLTHVSFHMSLKAFKYKQTTLHMHTKAHFTYAQTITKPIQLIQTHPQAFSLFLWGNLNNNSLCINARNANPHWSERTVSCGSAAFTYIKAIIERLASRQPAVFDYMCLLHTVMWNQMLPCEHPTGR